MPRAKVKKRARGAKTSSSRTEKTTTAVDSDKPLPLLYGPRLGAFSYRHSSIEFVSLLSEESPGRHSHVFEVIVEAKHYALKMFKFYDVAEDEAELADQQIPQDMIIAHLDPFYAECRAYGRIEDKNGNGKVAIRCYGFSAVPALQEDYLSEAFDISDWDRPPEEYDLPVAQRQSFRAIVKDLVEDEAPFRKHMVTRMLKDLIMLRRMGVFVQDVREDNYRGGKLVDFSVSMTAPHIMLSDKVRDEEEIEEAIGWELASFDTMIEESGILTWVRATPNKEYIRKLRPRR